MPCISVVMPVYNNEKYLPMAVRSILEQDYEDYELIIVDDGSTDKTPQIVDRIVSDSTKVRAIHQENQWIYASFNRGIQEAKGQYIYIVNSDDRLCPGALPLLARSIETYHPDVIWTKVIVCSCDEEQNILEYDVGKLDSAVVNDSVYLSQEEVRSAWPYFYKTGLSQNQANLYRRDLMLAHPFRNDVYGADTLFNISIAPEVKSAIVLRQPVYEFFWYSKENMNASSKKYYGYEHDMFNEIYIGSKRLFKQWNLPSEEYKEYLNNRRLGELTNEIRLLKLKSCKLSLEEKINHIFTDYMDETIIQCAAESNKQEELESRILSGVRELLLQEDLEKNGKMYFVYELLDALLCYEKDEEDYRKIREAINHPLNPAHIGRTFYNKLIKEEANNV